MNKFLSIKITEKYRLGKFFREKDKQKGITAIFVAIILTLLIAFAALAIDIGYYMVTRNELQNIADGAALAACREIGLIYEGLDQHQHPTYDFTSHTNDIISKAVTIGNINKAGGAKGIIILPGDVIIGRAVWENDIFKGVDDSLDINGKLTRINAVKVTARRDSTANSPILTFFATIFGKETIDVDMDATAALTGQTETEPGEVDLPVGISKSFFDDPERCGDEITFHPTSNNNNVYTTDGVYSCAGWNFFTSSPSGGGEKDIKDILYDIRNGNLTPATIAGDTEFYFTGGTLDVHDFNAFLVLFMVKGYDIKADGSPAKLDDDGNPVTGPLLPPNTFGAEPYLEQQNKNKPFEQAYYVDDLSTNNIDESTFPRNKHVWDTTVVVYDKDFCNPSGFIKIKGYAKITITDVKSAPDKKILGKLKCFLYSTGPTHGGGSGTGGYIQGTIPHLVE